MAQQAIVPPVVAAPSALTDLRPRLRGWLHAGTAPLALAGGLLLVRFAPAGHARVGAAVFALTALLLFSVSATLHRGGWSPRWEVVLTRLDHASIFLLIAGTYTPYALLMLPDGHRAVLLAVVWSGALLGIGFRLLRPGAPRWVYTPIYVALGWVAVAFAPDFARYDGGHAAVLLMAAGGLLYTLGAVVYGLRRPNPLPRWFGFHEVFHACTVLAFAAHFVGVVLATAPLR